MPITRPWGNGKVGLLGISYFAMNQWQVATLRPAHLTAICPWEGASDYYRERSAELERITVPLLSAANSTHDLHSRSNFEAYQRVASPQKWLEVHGEEHFTEFYTDYGVGLLKRFFGHFLKGEDTGWRSQPPVQLNVRRVDGSYERRGEQEWPLARTDWTRLYLDVERGALEREPAARESSRSFAALGDGLSFFTAPLETEVEITGPAAAKLFATSSTTDADLFVVLRVLDPAGRDVTFVSGLDPHGVVAKG